MDVSQVLTVLLIGRYYYYSSIVGVFNTSDTIVILTPHYIPVVLWHAVSHSIPSRHVCWPMLWRWYEGCICNNRSWHLRSLPLPVGDTKDDCHTTTTLQYHTSHPINAPCYLPSDSMNLLTDFYCFCFSEGKPSMALICATGPLLFSVSVRQVLSEYKGNDSVALGLRYAGDSRSSCCVS